MSTMPPGGSVCAHVLRDCKAVEMERVTTCKHNAQRASAGVLVNTVVADARSVAIHCASGPDSSPTASNKPLLRGLTRWADKLPAPADSPNACHQHKYSPEEDIIVPGYSNDAHNSTVQHSKTAPGEQERR